jgi:hypothetical protein
MLYFYIKFLLYINDQIEETISVINRTILNLKPYRITKSFELMIDLKLNDIKASVTKGDMNNAFVLIRKLYYEILSFHTTNRLESRVELNMNYLYKFLNISLPYLELTHKLFFLHNTTITSIPLFYLKIIFWCFMTIIIFYHIFLSDKKV